MLQKKGCCKRQGVAKETVSTWEGSQEVLEAEKSLWMRGFLGTFQKLFGERASTARGCKVNLRDVVANPNKIFVY